MRVEGCSEGEQSLTQGGRATKEDTGLFVGIDVAKLRNAVALAEPGRDGEVRYYGEVDASEISMRQLFKKLASRHGRLTICYEAGPTGYGCRAAAIRDANVASGKAPAPALAMASLPPSRSPYNFAC